MKVLFTAMMADARGKLAGSVFSRNRGGAYVRTKSSPTNPATTYQQNQRSYLATNSSAWRGLTQAQRDAWNTQSTNFPYTDVFGNVKYLSGQQLYVQLNTNLLVSSNSTISNVPTAISVPQARITTAAAAAGAGTFNVTLSDTTVPSGFSLLIYVTSQLSPGIQFAENKYRLLGKFTLTAGVANIASAYTARMGSLVAAKKIFVRAVYVSNTTGQVGIATAFSLVVAA